MKVLDKNNITVFSIMQITCTVHMYVLGALVGNTGWS